MLRVAVAGIGAWSRRTHLPALAAHDGVELIGVWGRDTERSGQLAAEFGIASFDSFEELVQRVDVVDLALAPAVQAEFATAAALAGRHLLLEKPVAMTGNDAGELDAVVNASGVVARTFLSRLFDAHRRPWLRESTAHEWRIARLNWESAGLLASSPAAQGWRAAAGPLFDAGPHVISQLEALLGEVSEIGSVSSDERGVIELSLVHESGAHSTSRIDLRREVNFTREGIVLVSDGSESSWHNEHEVDFVDAFRLLIDDLIDGVAGRESTEPIVTALSGTGHGARTVRLLEEIEAELSR
jgi:predicted dehydrogenase